MVAAVLLVAGSLYGLGWWRLWCRAPTPPPWTRLVLALGSVACIAVALLSPLHVLAEQFFVAHMTQHMLLIMVAVPSLLLADPFPIVLWALPGPARRRVGRWLTRTSPFGRVWRVATAMPVAWLAYASVLWLWHLPVAYDAALADPFVHDVEHLSFFLSAVLCWWPVIHPAPRVRRPAPYAAKVVYLVLTAFQTAALGLLLTLAPVVLYRSYAAARADALSALDDQIWGGVVMWGVGGLIEMIAVLAVVYRGLGSGARDGLVASAIDSGARGRNARRRGASGVPSPAAVAVARQPTSER